METCKEQSPPNLDTCEGHSSSFCTTKYKEWKVKENLLKHHQYSNTISVSLEQYYGGYFLI